MKLSSLFTNDELALIPEGLKNLEVKSLSCDSRAIGKDSLFVALRGTQQDGSAFIAEAVSKGAKVVVRENCQAKAFEDKGVLFVHVRDAREALLNLSNRFYGNPSQKVKTVGITGTNGKTTVSYLLESIFGQAEKKCAVIGTVNYRIAGRVLPSKNTTPGLLDNQKYLAAMASEGVDYCVMEVSSHALDQGRVDAVDFCAAVFTNLTGDHMDYHANMENYFLAKSKLFTALKPHAFAVINMDDAYGRRLLSVSRGRAVTYGVKGPADVMPNGIVSDFSGSAFTLSFPSAKIPVKTALIGLHNVYNILAAAGCAFSQGIGAEDIARGVAGLAAVPGRLEQICCGQDFHVFVDYAHTEDALCNVLMGLRSVRRDKKTKIILVFGCGGDRDKTKRPKMGKVASELADVVFVTSDNPRSENPQAIIDEIIRGAGRKNFEAVPDRREAIQKALGSAQKNDVVLIAGKGHEDYQIFKDKTVHFDDRETVRDILHVHR